METIKKTRKKSAQLMKRIRSRSKSKVNVFRKRRHITFIKNVCAKSLQPKSTLMRSVCSQSFFDYSKRLSVLAEYTLSVVSNFVTEPKNTVNGDGPMRFPSHTQSVCSSRSSALFCVKRHTETYTSYRFGQRFLNMIRKFREKRFNPKWCKKRFWQRKVYRFQQYID